MKEGEIMFGKNNTPTELFEMLKKENNKEIRIQLLFIILFRAGSSGYQLIFDNLNYLNENEFKIFKQHCLSSVGASYLLYNHKCFKTLEKNEKEIVWINIKKSVSNMLDVLKKNPNLNQEERLDLIGYLTMHQRAFVEFLHFVNYSDFEMLLILKNHKSLQEKVYYIDFCRTFLRNVNAPLEESIDFAIKQIENPKDIFLILQKNYSKFNEKY